MPRFGALLRSLSLSRANFQKRKSEDVSSQFVALLSSERALIFTGTGSCSFEIRSVLFVGGQVSRGLGFDGHPVTWPLIKTKMIVDGAVGISAT